MSRNDPRSYFLIDGVEQSMPQICRKLGLGVSAVYYRMRQAKADNNGRLTWHGLRNAKRPTSKEVVIDGEPITMKEAGKKLGITSSALGYRMRKLKEMGEPVTWEGLRTVRKRVTQGFLELSSRYLISIDDCVLYAEGIKTALIKSGQVDPNDAERYFRKGSSGVLEFLRYVEANKMDFFGKGNLKEYKNRLTDLLEGSENGRDKEQTQ